MTDKCKEELSEDVCVNEWTNCDDFKEYCGNPNVTLRPGKTVDDDCCKTCNPDSSDEELVVNEPVCVNEWTNCDDFKSYCGNPNAILSSGNTVDKDCC